MRRICVIGAGAAGLSALRHLSEPDFENTFEFTLYEQTSQLGGTWYYDNRVGVDENGVPIHTSMYRNLRTNLPKEVMGFPDFPLADQPRSYLNAPEILEFLKLYTETYNLHEYIKYRHQVLNVKKVENNPELGDWEVTVMDLDNKFKKIVRYHGVMVCTGHYHTPLIPHLEGIETFEGTTMHSHDYREPNIFADQRVLVIGAGPSGMDLTLDISKEAKQVLMSHHLPEPIDTEFPSNVEQRPDVLKVEGNVVEFVNNETAEVDVIFYCTGYLYSFPFLDESCGIQVIDNHVQPLFKHMFYINEPSLVFIGLPYYVCAFQLFDLQSRVYLSWMFHAYDLPSQAEMRADLRKDTRQRREDGLFTKHAHMMGRRQGDYYQELEELSGEIGILPVMTSIHNHSSSRFLADLVHYRQDVYRVIDNEDFECIIGACPEI